MDVVGDDDVDPCPCGDGGQGVVADGVERVPVVPQLLEPPGLPPFGQAVLRAGELVGDGEGKPAALVEAVRACAGLRNVRDAEIGPILVDQSCIIDCFPRDIATGCWSDMTRTFVPGTPSDDLRNLHGHVRKALDIAMNALKPGAKDAFTQVAEYFHSQGFPTQIHHDGPGPLDQGFMHALGHGVGLEVHEAPRLARTADTTIPPHAVVTIEPGIYKPGWGGVRIEDDVFLGDEGSRVLTAFSHDLLEIG